MIEPLTSRGSLQEDNPSLDTGLIGWLRDFRRRRPEDLRERTERHALLMYKELCTACRVNLKLAVVAAQG